MNNCSPGVIIPSMETNIVSADPQLVDSFHLAATSPCRAAGASIFFGSDIGGQAWGSPPSIGCDEYYDSDCVGAMSVVIQPQQTNIYVGRSQWLTGQITGRAARLEWLFGDGPTVTNVSFITAHTWTNAGDYTVTFTAYNTDNPAGVSTNVLVHVLPLSPPQLETPVLATNCFQFQFTGQSNAIYVLQRATNLVPPVVWQALQTISNINDVVQFTNTSSTNSTEFYRVLAQ